MDQPAYLQFQPKNKYAKNAILYYTGQFNIEYKKVQSRLLQKSHPDSYYYLLLIMIL